MMGCNDMKDLNFFSSYNKKQEKGIDKQSILNVFLLVSFIGIICYGSYNFYTIKKLNSNISSMQNQITVKKNDPKYNEILEKKNKIKDLRDNISKIMSIDKYLDERDVLNEFLLSDIENNLPSKVFLKSMVLNPDIIKIEGNSQDKESIAQFQHNLIELGLFQEVFIPQIVDNIDSFSFIMDIKYKEEQDGAKAGQ